MANDEGILPVEVAVRPVPYDVTLGRIVEHRIGPAPGLKGAVAAARKRFVAGGLDQLTYPRSAKDLAIGVCVETTQSETLVAHLGKHSTLVRCIHIPVVVVNGHTDPSPRGRL